MGTKENKPPFTKKELAVKMLLEKWAPEIEPEEVPLTEAAGRVLAEDLFAKYNIPLVRASFMDGVAVKSSNFESGIPNASGWKLGVDYVRADTGDDFPDEFDAVIAIESVKILPGGGLEISEMNHMGPRPSKLEVKPGLNVKASGSDIKEGMQVGFKGRKLLPEDLAAIAMGGYGSVKVAKKPVIAFIPTGSELVEAGKALSRGQNFDSNSIMVSTMLKSLGCEVLLHPIVKDNRKEIEAALDEMLPKADFVILNAGTSKGEEDFCVHLLEEKGELLLSGVAAVPGRPMSIGFIKGVPVVNMSGPAFAAYYGCNWLMRPVTAHLTGMKPNCHPALANVKLTEDFGTPPIFSALTGFSLEKDADGTLLATPISIRGPKAQESVNSFLADAFYMSTPGEDPHKAGDVITVRLRG